MGGQKTILLIADRPQGALLDTKSIPAAQLWKKSWKLYAETMGSSHQIVGNFLRIEEIKIPINRRIFLAALTGGLAALASGLHIAAAPQELHILKQGDTERLRLDFNAYRSKVRLLAILSPT
jgi:hypothetical protein